MRPFITFLAGVSGVAALMGGLTAMAAIPAAQPRGSQVAAPARGAAAQGSLADVAMLSRTKGWAVGYRPAPGRGGAEHTLIERWDGRTWSTLASPNPGRGFLDMLTSVAVVTPDDAWAVGGYLTRNSEGHPLILHWNGRTWSTVASPDPGSGLDVLQSVTMASAANGWAVGSYCARRCGQPAEVEHSLILHWNGRTWSTVASPNPGSGGSLLGAVAATSATSAWAAGSSCAVAGKCETLILHWGGTAWTRTASPTPAPGSGPLFLYGMSARSADDAWATGTFMARSGKYDTLILHWNGSAWSRVASPNPGPRNGYDVINGVTATSAANAWATGSYCARHCTQYAVAHPLILHWDGTAWSRVASPDLGPGGSELGGNSVVSAADAWAVGSSCPRSCELTSRYHPLILRWNGKNWSVSAR